LALLGHTTAPTKLDSLDGTFTEEMAMEQFGELPGMMCLMHIYKATLCFINEKYVDAWHALDLADQRSEGLNGSVIVCT
jgi:hypothetical protein